MNIIQICGGILSIVGTIIMFYGSYIQGQSDQKFQGNVEGFVSEQRESDVPELVALKVEKDKSGFILIVKNIGKQPATEVKVIFTEDSTPSAFAGNMISGAGEIPHNVEYTFPLNLFSGINMVMRLPNSEEGYKEALEKSLQKFNSGKTVFVPKFHIEYYFGEQKIVSPQYYLIVGKNGLEGFGKID